MFVLSIKETNQEDAQELYTEMDKFGKGLAEALKDGDKDDFEIALSDVSNKTAFVELLIDYGMAIEIAEQE